MIFDPILKNIERYVTLSEEEKDAFCSLLSVRRIKKRQFLVQEGEICLTESYINKGCFRNYITDRNSLEHNYYLAIEDWWVSDIYSRTFKVPSFCNIVALEDSELVQISQTNLDLIVATNPKIESFFRMIYQKSMAIHQHQLMQQLHMSAEERYKLFREKHPKFEQRIPQKHIATYLGMTPEFFNVIRSKIIKEL